MENIFAETTEPRDISPEEIAYFVELAQEVRAEHKFVLQLKTWHRPGPALTNWGRIDVLMGEINDIVVDKTYSYPHEDSEKHVIFPLTLPVVLHHHGYADYEGEWHEIFVFTRDGWKHLDDVA